LVVGFALRVRVVVEEVAAFDDVFLDVDDCADARAAEPTIRTDAIVATATARVEFEKIRTLPP